ncbi:hypothetical protein RUM43_006842 [Polyplax serrata]|uniref:SprT-like domain-containing protein n=1 Tax=Polyplax serrata TaxID=468196 RepID=A0AAN8P4P8_POLSC
MATKVFLNNSQRKGFNSSHVKAVEETITSGGDDTDIIECSIIENEKEQRYKFRGNSSANYTNCLDSDTKKESDKRPLSFTRSRAIANSIRLSLKKNFNLHNDTQYSLENSFSDLKTPVRAQSSEADKIQERLLSSLKKLPGDIPYLSRTKLNNIERWLECNDFEVVRTPPFANLSVTPPRGSKTQLKNRRGDRAKFDSSASIDSDVEDVLKAVYGNDWIEKKGKCKTEPKRRINRKFSPISSLRKPKVDASSRPFRRSILTNKETKPLDYDTDNNLNDSFISGVEMINLNDSSASLEKLKVNSLKKNLQKRKLRSKKLEITSSPSSSEKTLDIPVNSDVKKSRKKISPNKLVASSAKTPKRTFLASLSVSTPTSRCHPDAKFYKVNFKSKKEELIGKLYKLYNSEVFNGKLPGDLNFSWNVKLRGTAGYCYNKRITKSTGEVLRTSRIEFSTKIVDRADRLRDTMIHELCHAAAWVIDGMLDGHGATWNAWATKAMKRFPELPMIKRCHNYEIVSKYVYRCTGCGYSIKRHSKSINTERKRCGYCYGTLELLLNKKRKGKTEVPEFDATRTQPTPNKFAVFVKENYRTVRSTRTEAKHAEIMKILSQQYALTKATKQ